MIVKNIKDFSSDEFSSILKRGGIIIFPFDTCYGLVCDPTNQDAVNKLLKYKSNKEGKAISVAVSELNQTDEYVEINETAKNFARNFLPGPFTIVLKSKNKMAKGIESEKGTLGIRIPDSEKLIEYIKYFGKPVTSTSANQSYKKIPYSLEDIINESTPESLELIEVFVDAGKLEYKSPSTVIDLSSEDIQIIRKGSIIPHNAKFQTFISKSEEDTKLFAFELLKKYLKELIHRPLIFALQGDMGAGKTHFVKGIGEFLGVKNEMQSPTFIIISEYLLQTKNILYHIDTWRLDKNEIDSESTINFDMLLNKKTNSEYNNIIAVEWADKIIDKIQNKNINVKIIWIEIEIGYTENKRIIKWSE